MVEPLAAPAPGQHTPALPVISPESLTGPGSVQSLTIPNDANVDDRYKGKSAAELIEMHENATRKIGEQGAEIDTWRRLVADNTQRQVQSAPAILPPETPPVPLELSGDDLLSSPVASISQVVDRSLKDALGPIEDKLALMAQRTEVQQLSQDYPGMAATGQDEGFQTWAVASPGRAADAALASQGDITAARRLMEQWTDRQTLVDALKAQSTDAPNDQQQLTTAPSALAPALPIKPQGIEGARVSTLEPGGTGGAPPADALTADDIVKMIIENPEGYRSTAYQERVQRAAKAGQIVPAAQPNYMQATSRG